MERLESLEFLTAKYNRLVLEEAMRERARKSYKFWVLAFFLTSLTGIYVKLSEL